MKAFYKERLLRKRKGGVVGRRAGYVEGGNERMVVCWSRDTKFHVLETAEAHLNLHIFLSQRVSRDFLNSSYKRPTWLNFLGLGKESVWY